MYFFMLDYATFYRVDQFYHQNYVNYFFNGHGRVRSWSHKFWTSTYPKGKNNRDDCDRYSFTDLSELCIYIAHTNIVGLILIYVEIITFRLLSV